MFASSLVRSLLKSIAIYLIALCAVSMSAVAQNGSGNIASTKQAEQMEHDRIKRERMAATLELEQQRQACYQKLAVTPCLNEARDQHNEKTRDLKRQEVALNDEQRKGAAADRQRALDERNSPQVQLEQAQRRGRALEASGKREEDRAQRQSTKQTAAASAPTSPEKSASATQPKQPSANAAQGKPPQQLAPKLAPADRPGQAAKMEKSRLQAAEREKAAEQRRAEAKQREAKRKKPAAAPLPLQD